MGRICWRVHPVVGYCYTFLGGRDLRPQYVLARQTTFVSSHPSSFRVSCACVCVGWGNVHTAGQGPGHSDMDAYG